MSQPAPAWSRGAAKVLLPVAAWEIFGRVTADRQAIVPSPSRVLMELWTWRYSVAEKAAQDLVPVLTGILLSLAFAVPLALFLEDVGTPVRRPSRRSHWTIALPWPLLALIFPAVVWPGAVLDRVFLATLCAFVWLLHCLRNHLVRFASTTPELWDLARSLGASRWDFERKIRLRSALPGLFEGIRGASRAALTAVVVADFVAGDRGLGRLAAEAVFRLNRPLGFAVLLAILAVAAALEAFVRGAERLAHIPARPDLQA